MYDLDVKILAISDVVEPVLYGAGLSSYADGVKAVISCGDLPFEYLEYVITFSGAPLYYVRGNHDPAEDAKSPEGCVPLDGRGVDAGGGLVLAGLSGSRWYSGGPNQHAERTMRRRAYALSARTALRGFVGRGRPNVFVSHAPPLIDALQQLPECNSIMLTKSFSETATAVQPEDVPAWQWPTR